MRPDIALIKHCLSILRTIGPAGLPEEALMAEIEVAAGRPLTTAAARGTIIECVDRGFVASRRDDFGRIIYWLTEAGKNRLAGM